MTTYEIWNEPDLSIFWAPGARRRPLRRPLRARADAIKAVDPQARVIVGGLSNAPGFIPQLFGARPDLRAIRSTASRSTRTPGRRSACSPSCALAPGAGARPARRTTPLYVTEFGWVSASRAPRRSTRRSPVAPDYVGRRCSPSARVDCGVAAVVPYTWVTPEQDPADEEDWFGIRHPDDRPSAAERRLRGRRPAPRRRRRAAGPPLRAGGG